MKKAPCLLVAVIVLLVSACQPRVRHVNVSATPGASNQPAIARTGGRDGLLHIVWNEDPPGAAEPVVMYRRATRSHSSLSPAQPVTLGDASLCVGRPEIVATGSNIYVAFAHMPVLGDGCKVYVNASTNEGQSFRAQPIMVSTSGNAIDKRIAANGAEVHVTWRTSGNEIAYSFSNDAGTTFTSPLTITSSAGPSAPAIALSDDEVLIVFCTSTGDNLVNIRPRANPAVSSTDEPLVSASASGVCGGESIAANGGIQYLGWLEKNPSTNLTVRQRQGGSLGEAYSVAYIIDEFRSSRLVGGQQVAVAGHISSIGQSAFNVNLARKDFSTDEDFALPALLLGGPPGSPESFELIATSGYIHVLFEQSNRLYHAYSDNGGHSYNPRPPSGPRQPALAFDGAVLRGSDPDLEAHASDRFVVYASEPSFNNPPEIMLYTWRKR